MLNEVRLINQLADTIRQTDLKKVQITMNHLDFSQTGLVIICHRMESDHDPIIQELTANINNLRKDDTGKSDDKLVHYILFKTRQITLFQEKIQFVKSIKPTVLKQCKKML